METINSVITISPLTYIADRKYVGESRIHDNICYVDNYCNSKYQAIAYSNESFYLTANTCAINGQQFYNVAEPFVAQYSIKRPRKLYDVPGEFILTISGDLFLPMLNKDDGNVFNLRNEAGRLNGSLIIFDFIYYILFGMQQTGEKSFLTGKNSSSMHILNWIVNYIKMPGHVLPTNFWLLTNANISIDGNSDTNATWSLTFTSLANNFVKVISANSFTPQKEMEEATKEIVMRTMRTRDFYVNILNNAYNLMPIVRMGLDANINWEKKATNFSYFRDKSEPFLLNRYFSANNVSSNMQLSFIGEVSHHSLLSGFTSQTKANIPVDIYVAGKGKGFEAITNNLIILPKAFNVTMSADSFIKCDTSGNIIGMNNIYDTNEAFWMTMET